jgi:general stress protein 26
MATKTLSELAENMRDIDFCMFSTITEGGHLSSRPMSNNRDVAFDGACWFYAYETARFIGDIARKPKVGLSFSGGTSVLGKPGIFIALSGTATIIHDKAEFEAHWMDELERWFAEGTETPGMVMIKVQAERVHYWDGEDQGEVVLPMRSM